MKENLAKATAKAIKEITLSDIYDAIGQVKDRQEQDFRYLNQRIDNLGQKIDTEVGQVRQEMGQMNQRIDSLGTQLNQRIDTLSQKIDTQFAQLNQTMLQLIMSKQKES